MEKCTKWRILLTSLHFIHSDIIVCPMGRRCSEWHGSQFQCSILASSSYLGCAVSIVWGGYWAGIPPCLSAGFIPGWRRHQRSPPYAPAVRGALMIQRGWRALLWHTGDVENALLLSTRRVFQNVANKRVGVLTGGGGQVGQAGQQSPSQRSRMPDARLSFLGSLRPLSIFPSSSSCNTFHLS